MIKKNTKGIGAVLAGVVLGALIFFSTPGMLHAQTGTVQIVNNNPFGINIYTQGYDGFGRPFWRRIGAIPPKRTRVFPRVPNGILFGADNRGMRTSFPPQRVNYNRSMTYTITFPRRKFR